jgi:MFS family permease
VVLQSAPPQTIVSFTQDDPENPYNWSLVRTCRELTHAHELEFLTVSFQKKKFLIVIVAIILVCDSTISSAITSNAVDYIAKDLDVKGDTQMYLPVSMYLVGYIFGPLVFSPMSESIGRKPIILWTFNVFILFTMACALAPNWPALLIFRLVCGTCASVPLTVIGGLFADIFESPKTRGRAMVTFMSVREISTLHHQDDD